MISPKKPKSIAVAAPTASAANRGKPVFRPPTKADVRKTIESSGYPLELRTALTTESHGFFTTPNWTWFDPRSQKQRELDVVCQADWLANKASVHFHLLIECKAYKPGFVLFHFEAKTHDISEFNHLELGDAHYWGTPRTIALPRYPGTGSDFWTWSRWGAARWLPSKAVALQYGVIKQGKGDGWQLEQSDAHEAIDGLVASLPVYRGEVTRTPLDSPHPHVHFAIPLLVVDGPVYVYRRKSPTGRATLARVNCATLFRRTTTGGAHRGLVRVDVVASRYFERYMASLSKDAKATANRMDSHYELLVESAKQFGGPGKNRQLSNSCGLKDWRPYWIQPASISWMSFPAA